MEAYKNEDFFDNEVIKDSKIYDMYSRGRSWISAFIGVLITVFGVALMFVIASVEGTKEVKAKNSDSVKILEIWRNEYRENEEERFPKEKEVLIPLKDKEYYFVIDKVDEITGEITKWHFAYDGGIDYIFKDYKFYFLSGFAVILSVIVGAFNYRSSRKKEMDRKKFRNSLKYYQTKKKLIEGKSQYLPRFCSYKTKQAYESEKMDIILASGLDYNKYEKDKKYMESLKLEKWQKKYLKKIKKIKVKGLKPSDLLQDYEKKTFLKKSIRLLPMSMEEHETKFLISGIIQRIITGLGSGLIASFGIVLGEWMLGITYASMVLMAGISSSLIASDFVNTTLRNRYIAKGDYFQEFYNIYHIFVEEERQEEESLKREKAKQDEFSRQKGQDEKDLIKNEGELIPLERQGEAYGY